MYALIGVPVIFCTWAVVKDPDPYVEEKWRAKETIDLCWEDQGRKSHTPATARFVAGTCEMLEREYLEKYGRR